MGPILGSGQRSCRSVTAHWNDMDINTALRHVFDIAQEAEQASSLTTGLTCPLTLPARTKFQWMLSAEIVDVDACGLICSLHNADDGGISFPAVVQHLCNRLREVDEVSPSLIFTATLLNDEKIF